MPSWHYVRFTKLFDWGSPTPTRASNTFLIILAALIGVAKLTSLHQPTHATATELAFYQRLSLQSATQLWLLSDPEPPQPLCAKVNTTGLLSGWSAWHRCSPPPEAAYLEQPCFWLPTTPSTRLLLGLPLPINRATTADLVQLPGIGEVLARRLVAWRRANGPFRSRIDLIAVRGIGERKAQGLDKRLCYE